ncbi:MAG: hypothetical protein Q4B26_17490 [Eubacteriales bacterium]|nr:hypothetical protein [Eubacteriales bacterium]
MNNLVLRIGRDGSLYDYSQIITKLTFSGRKGAAPRSIDVSLAEVESIAKKELDSGEGQQCYLYLDGKEIFRGLLMTDGRGSKKNIPLKAYDDCVRLSNNKDSFSYNGKTASYIVKDCISKMGLKAGTIASTSHSIDELVKKATTYWDVIEDALSQTYKATGDRYYVYASKGKIYLKKRVGTKTMPHLSTATNIISWDYERSIYNTRTRVKLVTSKGDKKGEKINSSLEKKIGRFQDMETVDEDIKQTEINQRLSVFNREKAAVSQTLKITAMGDISCVAGGCAYVEIPEASIKRMMYIEEDSHTFEGGKHTMSLTMSYDKVTVPGSGGSSSPNKTYKVGDIVRFKGGYHYVSSDAKNPTGSKCAAGNAKITHINTASWAIHPYCLVHTDSSSRVYGWVDKDSFS